MVGVVVVVAAAAAVVVLVLVTHYVKRSPSEGNSASTREEIRILWQRELHYLNHISPTLRQPKARPIQSTSLFLFLRDPF
jgi:hypothetical protein